MSDIDKWSEPRLPKELEEKMNEYYMNMKKLWIDFLKEKENEHIRSTICNLKN